MMVAACNVALKKAGKYLRFPGTDDPVKGIERNSLTSKYMSVLIETQESTGILYAYSEGSWHYVWVSD